MASSAVNLLRRVAVGNSEAECLGCGASNLQAGSVRRNPLKKGQFGYIGGVLLPAEVRDTQTGEEKSQRESVDYGLPVQTCVR